MRQMRKRRLSLRAVEPLEPRYVLNGMPIISEFMASNDGTLLDGDGNDPDWIEIHNPTDNIVNLSGWHLTDNRANLDKWTFPNLSQSIIEPNGYLIVFASGQDSEDYVDPAGYLHTDFRLSADGEYLGLTDLAQNIIFEYAPSYPPQLTDVSYGVTQELLTLVDEQGATSVLVPTDGSLDATSPLWAQVTFDDSQWPRTTAGVGVGYDTATGPVEGPPNGTLLSELVGNDLTDPENDGLLNVIITAGGAAGSPAAEQPRHGLDSTTSTKWLSFSPEGTFFEMEFTDGIPKTVDSYTISSANDATERDPYSWTLSGSHDGTNYTVVDTRNAQDFDDRFETRLYEFANTDAYAFYRFDFETEFGVTGQNQPVAIQMAEIELLSSEAQGYYPLIDLDIRDAWDATKSSTFQRIEFDVDDPSIIGAMSLNMQYDDGFVAYLNGARVAAANNPAITTWQSNATQARADNLAVVPQTFDIGSGSSLLQAGTNVLAIHGLNVSDNSSDMLIRPQLSAVVNDTTPIDAGYYRTPTPGQANLGESRDGFVDNVEFSVERGFYDQPFLLTLTSNTTDAEIYYTTDGSDPTTENGTLYTSPILIDRTMAFKASGLKDNFFESSEVAHSYIFVNDVVSQSYQSTLDAGFPADWGGVSPDYGLDPDVIGLFDSDGNSLGGDNYGGVYADAIKTSLTSLPTLSIALDNDDLFSADRGLYANSLGEGVDWERETSFELIYPDGREGFQINAGLRMQGGAFRRHDLSKKHSLRLLFKGDYGPTKLDFPFFGEGAADRFDTITLRMESNDGWAWSGAGSQALYARDAFGSQTQLALGQHSSHNNRMHVYINGAYWGLYNPVERPDAAFSATYYGGEKEDWDAFNDGRTIDGSSTSWSTLVSLARAVDTASSPAEKRAAYERIQGKNPDGSNNPALEQYLDVDNYIDYLLVNFFMGNQDWPQRNWYASRMRGPESTGFKFHMWDAETSMGLNSSLTTNRLGVDIEAAEPYRYLRNHDEFRLRFADRAHRALFNEGALTRSETLERFERGAAGRGDPGARAHRRGGRAGHGGRISSLG